MRILVPVEIRYAIREDRELRRLLDELLGELVALALAREVDEHELRVLLDDALRRAREDA